MNKTDWMIQCRRVQSIKGIKSKWRKKTNRKSNRDGNGDRAREKEENESHKISIFNLGSTGFEISRKKNERFKGKIQFNTF